MAADVEQQHEAVFAWIQEQVKSSSQTASRSWGIKKCMEREGKHVESGAVFYVFLLYI
jgi:hypothetical protein